MQFAPKLHRLAISLSALGALGASVPAYGQDAEPAARLSYQPAALMSALELFGCGYEIGTGDEADWIVADLPDVQPPPLDSEQTLIACPMSAPVEGAAATDQQTERAVDFRSFVDAGEWTDATDDADVFSFNTQAGSEADAENRSGATNFKISESVKIKAQPLGGGAGGRVTLTFPFPVPK